MKATLIIIAALLLIAAPSSAQSLQSEPADQGTVVTQSPEGPNEFDTIKNPHKRPKIPRAPSESIAPPLPPVLLVPVLAVLEVLAWVEG